MRIVRTLLLLLALLAFAPVAQAQSFPKLTGRVVDAANLLDPAQEQALTDRLAAIETQSGRQLVVATIPDLQGYDISDFGYRLGRAWGIGDKAKNDGAVLIIAPNDRKVRIEVGYGLEGIMTDALSAQIIRNAITPLFKAGDMPGGINAGVDQIGGLLALPPDDAKARAAAAETESRSNNGGSGAAGFIWIIVLIIFVLLPMMSRMRGGKHYRRGGAPVIIWGPGSGDSGWGSGGGSSWGGGDGGGFSGGGGSFGGGGASGDW